MVYVRKMRMVTTSSAALLLLQLIWLNLSVSSAAQSGRIDTHSHYFPAFYTEAAIARNFTRTPSWNASAHLAYNKIIGVETSVVSVSIPGAKFSVDAPIEEGRQFARQLNEYGRNLTNDYPGQFLYFASLTLPDLEGAVAEAIYALDNLQAAGVIVYANAFGEVFGTSRYAPLYQALNDRSATVFIHPSASPCPEASRNPGVALENSAESVPPYVVDFLLDTTRAAWNLVYRNVTRDYPNITFILSHSGGFLPFAATRASEQLSTTQSTVPIGTLKSYFYAEAKKFNVDIAASATVTALPSTTVFFDIDSITFGTDYPYVPLPFVLQNIESYEDFAGLDSSDHAKIDYENARALFSKLLS